MGGGDPRLLAIENLDNYPVDFIDDVFEGTAFSRCIDIGHLWLEGGHDAVAYLEKHIHRARVLHIHGVAERDHKSLMHVSLDELKRVLNVIHQSGFDGVMTIEVFNEEDFSSSITQINLALAQLGGLSWQAQSGESAKPAKYHRDLYESRGAEMSANKELVLVLGGARSGKSDWAQSQLETCARDVLLWRRLPRAMKKCRAAFKSTVPADPRTGKRLKLS